MITLTVLFLSLCLFVGMIIAVLTGITTFISCKLSKSGIDKDIMAIKKGLKNVVSIPDIAKDLNSIKKSVKNIEKSITGKTKDE